MKKIINTLILVLSLSAVAEARFFLGVDANYIPKNIVDENGGKVVLKHLFEAGVNLGTEHYFGASNIVGMRWFLGASVGNKILGPRLMNDGLLAKNDRVFTIGLQLGIDVLVDIIKSENVDFGLFAGLDGGLGFMGPGIQKEVFGSARGFPLSSRIGLTLKLASHHRLETTLGIPLYTFSAGKDSTGKDIELYRKNLIVSLGYKFVF